MDSNSKKVKFFVSLHVTAPLICTLVESAEKTQFEFQFAVPKVGYSVMPSEPDKLQGLDEDVINSLSLEAVLCVVEGAAKGLRSKLESTRPDIEREEPSLVDPSKKGVLA